MACRSVGKYILQPGTEDEEKHDCPAGVKPHVGIFIIFVNILFESKNDLKDL